MTDGMFAAAADCLAAEIRDADLAAGSLYPPASDLRRLQAAIAEAVVRAARQEGVGVPIPDDDIPAAVRSRMWEPCYRRALPT